MMQNLFPKLKLGANNLFFVSFVSTRFLIRYEPYIPFVPFVPFVTICFFSRTLEQIYQKNFSLTTLQPSNPNFIINFYYKH